MSNLVPDNLLSALIRFVVVENFLAISHRLSPPRTV